VTLKSVWKEMDVNASNGRNK